MLIAVFIIKKRINEVEQKLQKNKNEFIAERVKIENEVKTIIAMELHDRVANDLFALTFTNDLTLKKNINAIIEKLRLLSASLIYSTSIEHHDISKIIEFLLNKYLNKSDSQFCLKHSNNNRFVFRLQLHEQHFYSIVQEICSNIVKHAHASKVSVSLTESNNYLHITIIDNGRGFDLNTPSKGIGLKNIKKRISQIHCKIEILSIRNKGTKINILIPSYLLEK